MLTTVLPRLWCLFNVLLILELRGETIADDYSKVCLSSGATSTSLWDGTCKEALGKEYVRIGEELHTASGYDPVNKLAGTSDRISMTRSAACDTYTACDAWVQAPSGCTQSDTTPAGYWDFTDSLSALVCGNQNWKSAFAMYSRYVLWEIGHKADIHLKNRIASWNGRRGDFMVISMTGTPEGAESEQCEMEAGIQMQLCNNYTADWTCSCQLNGQAGPLILLEQGAKLISGRQAACGRWFIGASTAIGMLASNMRAITLQINPVMKRCVLNTTCDPSCTDTPN